VAVGIASALVVVVLIAIIVAAASQGGNATTSTSSETQPTPPTTDQPTSVPTSAPTVQPTVVTPVPTLSSKQLEAAYKASTTDTTIATLDKDGNADAGKDVHFTATILNFVKDDSGDTAGANVDDPNTSGVVQIAFPPGTDLSQLNEGDTIEVWGTNGGTATGQNAFGATIQEVVISANYMTDKTTGYQTH
jgi:hypothetical protein